MTRMPKPNDIINRTSCHMGWPKYAGDDSFMSSQGGVSARAAHMVTNKNSTKNVEHVIQLP